MLIYCDFAILVLRAQGGLLWLKLVRSYWWPMETALLDNHPEVFNRQKPHFHCYVLVDKGTWRSFLSENRILQSFETVRNQLRLPCYIVLFLISYCSFCLIWCNLQNWYVQKPYFLGLFPIFGSFFLKRINLKQSNDKVQIFKAALFWFTFP